MTKSFTPLRDETRSHVSTANAAWHLDKTDQCLRLWAMNGSGPVRPVKVGGRLMWPVDQIRAVLGLSH